MNSAELASLAREIILELEKSQRFPSIREYGPGCQLHLDFPEPEPLSAIKIADTLYNTAKATVKGKLQFVRGLKLPSGFEGVLEEKGNIYLRIVRNPNDLDHWPIIRVDILFDRAVG